MKNNNSIPNTILWGISCWDDLDAQLKHINPSSIYILTDTHTKKFCLPILLEHLQFLVPPKILTVEAGEEFKTLESCKKLWDILLHHQADRSSLLLNLGGGVLTDLGGFVAATYKRGIDFIHIPTSLLAMVDAAIGGKNGINFKHTKNQIGTITTPKNVIVFPDFLKTLPHREFLSGTAEMFKHGLIASRSYWNKLKETKPEYDDEFHRLILESIQIKSKIVEQDIFEKNSRKSLNFGHTLGHAIEAFFLDKNPDKALLHGEAIAIGMVLELYLSHKLCALSKEDLEESSLFLTTFFGKINFSKTDIKQILSYTLSDKKNKNGKVLFVLLDDIGNCVIDTEVPESLIYKAFDFYQEI